MIETNFKHTEIGLIPHDWEVKTLGEVYSFRYGLGNTNPHDGGIYPIYGANGIIGSYSKYNAEDSVVIGHMGEYAGSVLWGGGKHFVTYNGTITRPKDENQLHSKYGFYALLRLNINRICAGSGYPFLAYDKLNSLKILLPQSIAEQERIADALSKIDSLIVGLDELLEKKRAIKTGTMQQLLTGKKRLKGFTGKWEEETVLGGIIDVYKGQQVNNSQLVEDTAMYPMLNGGSSISGYYTKYNAPANSITISEGGNSCGFINYMKVAFWAGGHCYIVRPIIDIDRDFLYYILKKRESDIMKLRVGSGLPNIQRKSLLKEISLSLPPTIEEQQAIASILSSMDTEIASLEQKRDKYIAIKQGMMQQLLTGKIRLV